MLKHWIPLKELNWKELSKNPKAIHLLSEAIKEDPDKIYWPYLSRNPEAIHLLEENKDRITWRSLSENPNAIHLLSEAIKEDPEKIYWPYLSLNSNALFLLRENPEKIYWYNLSDNTNPEIVQMLIEKPEKIHWGWLSANSCPEAIDYLLKNTDKINWGWFITNSGDKAVDYFLNEFEKNPILLSGDNFSFSGLSRNKNPKVIDFLSKNPDIIDWYYLSSNPSAMSLINEEYKKKDKRRLDLDCLTMNDSYEAIDLLYDIYLNEGSQKINWTWLSSNPAIFDDEYVCK